MLDSFDSSHLAFLRLAWLRYIAEPSWLDEQPVAADVGQSFAVVAFVEVDHHRSRLYLGAHVSIRLVNEYQNDLRNALNTTN